MNSRYYFALPRLWAALRGRDATRGEQNWIEAYFVGVAVFLNSYALLLAYIGRGALSAIALLFVTWVGWVGAFYINSLIVRALQRSGLFVGLTPVSAQSSLIAAETTACAVLLTKHPFWSIVAWPWLILLAANCAAAVALRFGPQRDA